MLKNVSHTGGVEAAEEILFDTPFGYMFRDTAESPECVLPVSARTQKALIDLGDAMGDASAPPDPSLDCGIPAGFTYLGQFIDHDITARTDRDTNVSRIPTRGGKALPVRPLDPEDVVDDYFAKAGMIEMLGDVQITPGSDLPTTNFRTVSAEARTRT